MKEAALAPTLVETSPLAWQELASSAAKLVEMSLVGLKVAGDGYCEVGRNVAVDLEGDCDGFGTDVD